MDIGKHGRMRFAVAEAESTNDFVARSVRAVQKVRDALNGEIIWWVDGDTSSSHGGTWMAALDSALSVDDTPLIYLPEIDVDSPGGQLIEHWFSLCGIRDSDMDALVARCEWDCDLLLTCLVIANADVHMYRRREAYKVVAEALESDVELFVLETARDNDALGVSGSVRLIKVFEESFRNS